jgi:hypothetical protein
MGKVALKFFLFFSALWGDIPIIRFCLKKEFFSTHFVAEAQTIL